MCPQCGAFVCENCKARGDAAGLCPDCTAKAEKIVTDENGQTVPPGFVDSFVPRFKAVLTKPAEFFSAPTPGEAPSHPYLFAILCYSVGGLFQVAYNLVFQRTFFDSLENINVGLMSSLGLESVMAMDPGQTFLQAGLLMPLQAVFMLFFTASVVHLFLLIFGRPTLGYFGTVRVTAYSNATHLLLVVPFLGAIVSFFWQAVILIIGLSRTHRMTSSRAAAAVLLPFGLLILLGIILAVTMLPLILDALGG